MKFGPIPIEQTVDHMLGHNFTSNQRPYPHYLMQSNNQQLPTNN